MAKSINTSSKLTKADLKTGMVVEYANGKRRLVILDFNGEDILFGCGEGERFSKLDNFNDDLTHKKKEALNIVKIYNHSTDSKADGDLYNDTDLICDLTATDDGDVADDESGDDVVFSLKDICDTLGFVIKRVR